MAYNKADSLAAFCYQNGYTDTISNIVDGEIVVLANPETMESFKERAMKEFYENSVIAYETKQAGQVASESKAEEVREASVANDIKIEEVVKP